MIRANKIKPVRIEAAPLPTPQHSTYLQHSTILHSPLPLPPVSFDHQGRGKHFFSTVVVPEAIRVYEYPPTLHFSSLDSYQAPGTWYSNLATTVQAERQPWWHTFSQKPTTSGLARLGSGTPRVGLNAHYNNNCTTTTLQRSRGFLDAFRGRRNNPFKEEPQPGQAFTSPAPSSEHVESKATKES